MNVIIHCVSGCGRQNQVECAGCNGVLHLKVLGLGDTELDFIMIVLKCRLMLCLKVRAALQYLVWGVWLTCGDGCALQRREDDSRKVLLHPNIQVQDEMPSVR